MTRETRAVGRPLPPDLVAEKAGRYVEECASCAYPFDEGDRLYYSEAEAQVFCSKACAADYFGALQHDRKAPAGSVAEAATSYLED